MAPVSVCVCIASSSLDSLLSAENATRSPSIFFRVPTQHFFVLLYFCIFGRDINKLPDHFHALASFSFFFVIV
jgi:hypothetical protein